MQPSNFTNALTRLSSQISGLSQSFFIALCLAVISYFGAFASLDGRVYDAFLRNAPKLQDEGTQVLLIDSPIATFFSESFPWERVVEDLLELGASQVVFTVFPEGNLKTALVLREHPNVILSTDLMPDPERKGSVRPNLPAAFGRIKPHAIAGIGKPVLGVHRYQNYTYELGNESIPSLESLSASRLGIPAERNGQFLINFGQPSQSFPRITLTQVVEGTLVKDIVAERVAVIGIGLERFHRSVVTPITGQNREVTRLEYHGYALNSLLGGIDIATFTPLGQALLILVAWLAFFLLAQPMGFRGAVVVGLLMFGALFGIAWLSLLLANVHIPIIGFAAVIATTLMSVMHRKSQHHDRALSLLVNTAGMAQTTGMGDNQTPLNEEFWPYAMGMVDQAVPITRAIFLQRTAGTSRLRPVHALRCAENALVEPNADLSQIPFSSASAAAQAVRVDGLLAAIPGERDQFVVPLVLKGELLGFLIFGTSVAEKHHPALLRGVQALCRRLIEMIESSRQPGTAEAVAPSFVRKYLVDDRDELVEKLNFHLKLANRQSQFLVAVLNWLRTPTMVYDLFGRPLFTNSSMKALLKEAGVKHDGGASAAELIELTCGLPSEDARLVLTELTVEGKALDRTAWAGTQQYQLQGTMLGGSNLLDTTFREMLEQAHGALFQLVPAASQAPVSLLPQSRNPLALAGRTDAWQPLEAAIAEITSLSEFEGLTFVLNGDRDNTPVTTEQLLLKDFLQSVLQLMAYDCELPGRVEIDVKREDGKVVMGMRNHGFGMPDKRLQTMLEGTVWPQSGTLRRIRQLRATALGPGGRMELTSAVGEGYRALVVLEAAS